MTGYDDRCPYCRERATLSVQYGGNVGPCPLHAVHWAGEPGQGPTSLHGNGVASFALTSGDEDDVTCKLCLTLLDRESSDPSRRTTPYASTSTPWWAEPESSDPSSEGVRS